MARIQVDPEVQSASSFPVWAPGQYTLRISQLELANTKAGKPMLVLQEEPVGEVCDDQGNVIDRPGRLFDRVVVDPVVGKNGGKISFLRPLIEAAGLNWSDFDTEDLVGKEVKAQVVIEEYQGKKRNAIGRYIKG